MTMLPRSSDDVENCRFVVEPSDYRKHLSTGFTCVAPTRELAAEWTCKLDNLLKTQSDLIKALQSPIAYQKELTKDM